MQIFEHFKAYIFSKSHIKNIKKLHPDPVQKSHPDPVQKSHPDPVQKFLNPNQQPHTRMYVLYNVQTSTIGLIDFEEKNWTLAMLCQIVLGPQFAF